MIHKLREAMQYKGTLIAGVFALAILGAGCGDDDNVTAPEEFAPPTDLVVVNGDGELTLTWEASPDENAGEFRRYNIYRHIASIANVDPTQLEQLGYLVASVDAPTHTYTYTAANGTLYYFHVRAETDDGKLSGGTNEEPAAARDEGTGVIIEEFESTEDSGFDFSTGQTVSLSVGNPNRFTLTDIYLGTTDDEDNSAQPLALKSPHLLANREPDWAGKVSGIKYLGTQWDVSSTSQDGFAEFVTFGVGAVFAVRTPTGTYAKMQISVIDDTTPGQRSITFNWAHQPTPGLIEF